MTSARLSRVAATHPDGAGSLAATVRLVAPDLSRLHDWLQSAQRCGRRITAITSASQADDEGSTPFARSNPSTGRKTQKRATPLLVTKQSGRQSADATNDRRQ